MHTESLELSLSPEYEIFRPLVSGWVSKIEAAKRAKAHWQEVTDECRMFFSKSAAAMWDPKYEKKFWRGVKAPKFRISINKAFEMVATFGPNLLWDVPHRTVEPKRALEIPQDFLQFAQQDPGLMQMLQMIMPMQQQSEVTDKLVAYLMQTWLNYTPREQPEGGLITQSELAVVDALVTGRGITTTKPYRMPQSRQVLTGSFRISPDDVLFDPDFKSPHAAKWIAIKRVDTHWELERRFELPPGSLKGRASLESSWHYGEVGSEHRQQGQTNDLVVWYEVYSKTGCGARMTGMHFPVKQRLEEVIGDFAYLAIAPSVPFPLNCSSRALQVGGSAGTGLSDEEVREKFEWPIPYWADDRWPIELLDFYPDTESCWPIAPLAPGLGELKFLNFLIPWAANRIYSSSRDFWAVLGPHYDHYLKYLKEGEDQCVIPTPLGVDDIRKAVQIMQQPETRFDIWKIIELVSELFDKRVGLTEGVYGRNENGTQNRTAEETLAKQRAVGVRPDHMRRKVVAWQSALSSLEAFCARWFVQGEHVEPLMGPMGRLLWERYVMSTDVQLVVREMKYTVSAASIRRPDRDRDVANFQQMMQFYAPVAQQYGFATGNYQPFNGMLKRWGDLHDMRMDELYIPPPPPPAPAAPDPQAQVELQKAQMDLQGKQIDQQTKMIQAQAAQQKAATDVEVARQKLLIEQAKAQTDLQFQQQAGQIDMLQKALATRQELEHSAITNAQDIEHQAEMAKIKQQMAKTPKPTSSSKA